jgi:hypothetical protein
MNAPTPDAQSGCSFSGTGGYLKPKMKKYPKGASCSDGNGYGYGYGYGYYEEDKD